MDPQLFRLFMRDKCAEYNPEEYQRMFMLYMEGIEQWKVRKMQQMMNKSYQAGMMGQTWKDVKVYEDELNEIIREQSAVKHNNLYLWLTVSPKKDVGFDLFKCKVEKAVTRRMFKSYLYVFEQRGKDESTMGQGFHAHILLKRNLDYKPCKIITNIKNTFKEITLVNNGEIFNWHWCPSDFKADKVEYITGLKTDEGKDEKQIMDSIWREQNNLATFYGNLEI
jgi:hypothetical protein